MKKKVMVFGTFDILHQGHLFLFKKAKELSDELYVIVAKDVNVEKFKKNLPKNNEQQRLENIKNIEEVNQVTLGDENDIYKIIEEIKPDIIALGYDQDEQNLKNELEKRNLKIKIVRLEAFKEKKFKSSLLKNV
jgi:FAD synthetase